MRLRPFVAVLVVGLLASCATIQRASTTDDLSGLSLPLLTDGGIRWAVAGRVAGIEATAIFDTSRELSSATRGCFEDGNPPLLGMVNVAQANGSVSQMELSVLAGLTLGPSAYRDFNVAIDKQSEQGCTVRLGLELLEPYALKYQARESRLTIRRGLTDAEVSALDEEGNGAPLRLGKTHQHEWLLWVTRLQQGAVRSPATVVLDTGTHQSRLSVRLVSSPEVGLLSLAAMAKAIGEEKHAALHAHGSEVFVQAWELTPSIRAPALWAIASEKGRPDVDGALGGDVWGGFDLLLDVRRGLGWLSVPARGVQNTVGDTEQDRLAERYFKWHEQQMPQENPMPEPAEP